MAVRGPRKQKDNKSKNPVLTRVPKKGYLQKRLGQHQKQISQPKGR